MEAINEVVVVLITFKYIEAWENEFVLFLNEFIQKL